ncbi:hypothetical protein CCACVL1_05435 [Corchorus capsularis]|uniref:Uncharacterized protein n=1 Tax=Corchorus capsularis TaxID=210143 RepID=A0A1R3JKL8_COCAP|nr:hypothetical protein CCACVL1_05435 [Corchorus capsularis]
MTRPVEPVDPGPGGLNGPRAGPGFPFWDNGRPGGGTSRASPF